MNYEPSQEGTKEVRIAPELEPPITSNQREGTEESPAYCTATEGEPAFNSEDNSDLYADMPILLPPS